MPKRWNTYAAKTGRQLLDDMPTAAARKQAKR